MTSLEKVNGVINGLDSKLSILQGDLFEALAFCLKSKARLWEPSICFAVFFLACFHSTQDLEHPGSTFDLIVALTN